MPWIDRIGQIVVFAGMTTVFVLIALDIVSWAGIGARVWAGIGAIICLVAGIKNVFGKAEP